MTVNRFSDLETIPQPDFIKLRFYALLENIVLKEVE